MYCPSFPEDPTMQTLIVSVPERPGHSVSSDSPLDAAIDEGLRGLGADSDSMRTTPRSGTFREHSPSRRISMLVPPPRLSAAVLSASVNAEMEGSPQANTALVRGLFEAFN